MHQTLDVCYLWNNKDCDNMEWLITDLKWHFVYSDNNLQIAL